MGESLRANEAQLLERASGGDRAAFDDLVRSHLGEVYGLIHRLVGNHEDAEDLAQDCFVKAFRSLRFYRGEGTFAAWLGRIAVHLARDHHRRRGRQLRTVALELTEVELAARSTEELTQRELVSLVGEAVEDLPHNLRAALVLRVLEGRDYDEVARATGMKPGTVRTQVMKARKRLLSALRPWIGEEER
jgi:RNA polymerase sigma-70 factor (ECF subfamily)